MLLGILPLSAFAADWGEGDTLDDALAEFKVGYHNNWLDWLTLPGLGVINQRYAYFLFDNERTGTVYEHPVYYIDPTKGGVYEIVQNVGLNDDGSNTATYIRSERVGDVRYLAILGNGYPHNKYTSVGLQSEEEGYYATKIALWMYIRGNDATKLYINPKYGEVLRKILCKRFSTRQNGSLLKNVAMSRWPACPAEPFIAACCCWAWTRRRYARRSHSPA